ncbi:MAG TPA: nucleotide-binding protein [Gemmatimonadaceae bacterium]|nr:nucleotide-binding protein [Gemmatimonadaceae bacterium]
MPDPELRVPPEVAASQINDRIEKGRAISGRDVQTVEALEQAENDYRTWTSYNGELLNRLFTTDKYQEEYNWWGVGSVSIRPPSPQERLDDLRKDIAEKIQRLESIRERLELIPLAAGVSRASVATKRPHTNKAFVVHGHDEASRETVARFLEKLGITAVILHEQATEGRTLVEKLEHYADVDFAVVLLTPDDIGAASSSRDDLKPRARQNVVLELGFFVGKLGRKNVCALHRGPLDLPSDYLGVGYVPLDDGGGWRLQLAKELRTAGFAIDMNEAL